MTEISDCVNVVMRSFAPPVDEEIGLTANAAISLFRSLVELVYTSIESHIASERRIDELATVSSRCRAAWVENVRNKLGPCSYDLLPLTSQPRRTIAATCSASSSSSWPTST